MLDMGRCSVWEAERDSGELGTGEAVHRASRWVLNSAKMLPESWVPWSGSTRLAEALRPVLTMLGGLEITKNC